MQDLACEPACAVRMLETISANVLKNWKALPGAPDFYLAHEKYFVLIVALGCVSLRKFKIGFLNPKESKNGFCVSLLDR